MKHIRNRRRQEAVRWYVLTLPTAVGGRDNIYSSKGLDAELSCDCSRFGFYNRRVHELSAGFLYHPGNINGYARINGAHVDTDLGFIQYSKDRSIHGPGML